MPTQGNQNLIIVDDQPSVTKLWNGRFRLEFFCDHSSKKTGWHEGNIANILPAFGIALGDKFGVGEWSTDAGYDDCTLIAAELEFVPSASTHYVKLVYETLTSTFVQEKDDTTDYELNGLRRVIRPLIATAGTDYQKVVGTTTISHQVDTETAVTLYLASAEIDDTDAYRRVEEVWIEAGILRISDSTESDGVRNVSTTFLVTEGVVVGPVVSRDINNYSGLQTITVSSLQDADGNSIVDGGENLVNQVSGLSPFTYPGIFEIFHTTRASGGGAQINAGHLLTKAPAQCKVATTTYFIFQTSNSIAESDYTYSSSDGLWSPNHWGSIQINVLSGTLFSFNDSFTFRGYRTADESTGGTISGGSIAFTWNGREIFSGQSLINYTYDVDQGPPNPVGNTYTLDVQVTPAFDDVDGNQYYKKTIIVTEAIPAQPLTASLPYS